MKFQRNFETKIISRLMQKRKLLISLTLILQGTIYFSIFFPLWLVRVKENINATLIGYDLHKEELKIRISEEDKKYFSPGKKMEVFTKNFCIKGIVNELSRSRENILLAATIKNNGSDYTKIPNSREIKIVTRGKRILELLFEKWNGKSIGNLTK